MEKVFAEMNLDWMKREMLTDAISDYMMRTGDYIGNEEWLGMERTIGDAYSYAAKFQQDYKDLLKGMTV
jgi:hypothetical protein